MVVGHPIRTGGHGAGTAVVLPGNVTTIEVVVGWGWEQGPLTHLEVILVESVIVTHGWTGVT